MNMQCRSVKVIACLLLAGLMSTGCPPWAVVAAAVVVSPVVVEE
jgi:hypothetical protein